MTIAFATSFRAKALAHDWPYHVWLLERTVDSMLSQGDDVSVVVGCHDIPDSPLVREPRVHFVPVTVPPPPRSNDEMLVDKVVKNSAAARFAVSDGAGYVIINDADDLVSDRVVPFVKAHAGQPGWYSASQWFYAIGGRLVRHSVIADPSSGPFVAIRADLLRFASPPFTGAWADLIKQGGEETYLDILAAREVAVCEVAAAGLGHYRACLAAQGHPLAPLPFAANLVINHADSMSTVGGSNGYPVLSRLGFLRRSLRLVPTMRLVTARLRREFGIPPDNKVPPQYRSGSALWR